MKKYDKSALMRILINISDTLTGWLSKDTLKQSFLESSSTETLRACNFENTLTMTIIFVSKMFKIWWKFQKNNKKWGNLLRF